MSPTEASKLLTIASTYDGRIVTPEAATTWSESLHGIDPADAAKAITEHFRTSTAYLLPAHVVELARKVRRDREREERLALPRPEPTSTDPEKRRAIVEQIRNELRSAKHQQ